ncbi:MAG: zinc-ribbon domain-containing protein [Flavobacterium sp.]|nr:zinc-ribbon domain-containing protein [Flavobacterium sp.]
MLFIKGKRTVRIKRYSDYQHKCPSCGMYNLQVSVYKPYFHVFFIPIVATDVKSSKIVCNHCSQPIRIDSLQKHYESITKIPFYLYAGVIFAMGFIIAMFCVSGWASYERSTYTKQPQLGDVFVLKSDSKKTFDTYYFLRVNNVKGDSITFLRNNLLYLESVSQLDTQDFFDASDTVVVSRKTFIEMYEKDDIIMAQRNYDSTTGFYRIIKHTN